MANVGGTRIPVELASRYSFGLGLANLIIASAATVPVIVPELALPLKLQIWPGTWMFIAYMTFLIAGVVGMFVWSMVYFLSKQLFGLTSVNRVLTIAHLGLFEIGVLGATSLMGIFPGYVGGTLMHDGFGQLIVTRVIEWAVIPIGVLIATSIFGALTGVVNIVFNGR